MCESHLLVQFLNKFEIRSNDDFFFRISLTDEHDSCVSYWILFFYNAAHSSLAMPTKFFFLWKKTVQNFCMATFKNVETFITHCPPICSKFAMLLGVQKQRTHTYIFFPLQMIMIAFWKCKDSSPLRFSHLASCCNIMRCGSLCDLERHLEKNLSHVLICGNWHKFYFM